MVLKAGALAPLPPDAAFEPGGVTPLVPPVPPWPGTMAPRNPWVAESVE